MSEGANNEQEQNLREIDGVAKMTRWEKFEFWFSPVFWATSMGALFLVSAFCVVGTVVIVLFHFQIAIHHPDRLKYIGTYLAYLAAALAISGAVLLYPIKVFRKMARRKKESGSLCPSGEELAARRYRQEHPSVWLRIPVVLFFCLIAFAATHSLWISPDRQVFFAWGIPALVWLVAFMAVVDAISPRPGRQWTGFVVSGAFGLIAVLAGALIFHRGKYSPSDSFFPLLMAFLSLLSSIISVHEGKKKVRNVPASHVC